MTVSETLAALKTKKGIVPSADYTGTEKADDFIFAIQTDASTQTKESDWIVFAERVKEHSGALNASTEDTPYIRAGTVTEKGETQRTFSLNGNRCVGEPVLDYRCDADYIVGAFQQAYGIDLTADKVHWWRFKALLHALPPETPLGKIVEIRGKDTSGMDRADRDYYETLKERFALPDGLKGVKRNETLQEHEDAFLNRFG